MYIYHHQWCAVCDLTFGSTYLFICKAILMVFDVIGNSIKQAKALRHVRIWKKNVAKVTYRERASTFAA